MEMLPYIHVLSHSIENMIRQSWSPVYWEGGDVTLLQLTSGNVTSTGALLALGSHITDTLDCAAANLLPSGKMPWQVQQPTVYERCKLQSPGG